MSIIKGKKYPYGVHIPDMKYLCAASKIETMPAPGKLYISLSQHIGAPATPLVAPGDLVKKGQMVGQENGVVSANVFSSVSGKVCAVEDIVNGTGQKQKYVVIENDGKNEEILFPEMKDFSPRSIIERIRLTGIVGLGGAGFPTAVKLSPKNQLDVLVVNGAECEPYLNCDNRLMLERTDDIYKGIIYVAKALNVKRIIIGIEKNKPEAVRAFSKFDDIEVVILKKQYPVGSEKHLIYCTTGRKVPVGKMPFDVGCCVQNIKTMIACYEAIELNKPLTEIVMTVSGGAVNVPKNLKVAIGTPFEDIIAYCGGLKEDVVKLVCGGPMMGKTLSNSIKFASKTDSGLLALSKNECTYSQPSNCINCARCANNCPMRLMPMYIEAFTLAGDYKGAEKYGALNCIECGSCAYNCPSRRALVESIRFAKAKIKEAKQNNGK